jgi:hypothetical protein
MLWWTQSLVRLLLSKDRSLAGDEILRPRGPHCTATSLVACPGDFDSATAQMWLLNRHA